ncbi:GNAT family N-acetyltransferase [Patescibacteria group bacterium]|nr:GNAT family N-acetyltransferase [Patescibacteria group bacterium]
MNNSIITQAKKENIKNIVIIHKKCIVETNADIYDPKVIESWLGQINEKNVLSQFDNTSWIIIKKSNKIIGFAQYDLEDQNLYQIQIDPDYQGKGYGKKLYRYIEKEFIKNNKNKISLNATLNAKRFYTSLGFKTLENILFGDIEMVCMEKKLVK